MPETLTHQTIEGLAAEYASAVEGRRALTAALRRRLLEVADELAPALREAAAAERDCHAALVAAVEAAPELFARPRTRTVHGVKYGWQTGKARIEIPDEPHTLALIHRHVDPAQQGLLIQVKESVSKSAVLDLEAKWLRRLGIVQHDGVESVVVKPVQDAADKLVSVLLAESGVGDA